MSQIKACSSPDGAQQDFESSFTIFLDVLVVANIGLFLCVSTWFKRSKLILF